MTQEGTRGFSANQGLGFGDLRRTFRDLTSSWIFPLLAGYMDIPPGIYVHDDLMGRKPISGLFVHCMMYIQGLGFDGYAFCWAILCAIPMPNNSHKKRKKRELCIIRG
jgi:hypothetical protein